MSPYPSAELGTAEALEGGHPPGAVPLRRAMVEDTLEGEGDALPARGAAPARVPGAGGRDRRPRRGGDARGVRAAAAGAARPEGGVLGAGGGARRHAGPAVGAGRAGPSGAPAAGMAGNPVRKVFVGTPGVGPSGNGF